MYAFSKIAAEIGRTVIDFALPPRCPGCGLVVKDEHRFCPDCWKQLRFLEEPCCTLCGFPLNHGGGADLLCGACVSEPPPFSRLRAAVAYGEIARKVALKLKYGGRPGAAETMARYIIRHIGDEDREGSVLTPVPLHRWRIWKRGYNQSALIASVLGRMSGIEVRQQLLTRTRATPPLKGMGRRERAMIVRGAFTVPKKARAYLSGRKVILVDDVFTSGATVNACAKALLKEGASKVEVLCWARVIADDD